MIGNIATILGSAFVPPSEPRHDPPEVQLADAIRAAGIKPPSAIKLDGKLHRFDIAKGDKAGWYAAFSDNIPAGRFGDWKNGIDKTWRADVGRELTVPERMAEAKRLAEAVKARDAELAKSRKVAADTADGIWHSLGSSSAAPDHPYLARKGVQPHGARVTGDGRLVLPLYSPEGDLASLQYIAADGEKRYHPGGQTGGCYWMIGQPDGTGPLYIAEGFASAATVAEETGGPCAVAYQASNLAPIAAALRAKHGSALDLVIVADNDKSGTGQKYANEAAKLHRARVVLPPDAGQDVNDYRAAGGNVVALLAPPARAGLAVIDAGQWHGQPVPERDWIVPGWLMPRAVTLLAGGGGTGKSLLIQQWLSAIALHDAFVGLRSVAAAPCLYINCEDEAEELHRRQVAIANALNRPLCDYAGRMHFAARVGMDNALGIIDDKGKYSPNFLFNDIMEQAIRLGARVIALDNAMQLFVGNLNDPREVTVFCNALSRLAIKTNAAVLLAGHIAKAEGSEFAGTMAWENAVRMRLHLARPTDGKGKEIEGTDHRLLVRGKANSASKGEKLQFTWHAGAFYLPVDIDVAALLAGMDARAEAAFLCCLHRATEQRRNVSHMPSANYAPKLFAKMSDAVGIGQKALEQAMHRLFDKNQIVADTELWRDDKSRPKRGIKRV